MILHWALAIASLRRSSLVGVGHQIRSRPMCLDLVLLQPQQQIAQLRQARRPSRTSVKLPTGNAQAHPLKLVIALAYTLTGWHWSLRHPKRHRGH